MIWNEKQILRVKMREAVRSFAAKASASEQIRHHLRNSAPLEGPRGLFSAFVALPGEPDWLGEDLPADKLLAFPKVSGDGSALISLGSTCSRREHSE